MIQFLLLAVIAVLCYFAFPGVRAFAADEYYAYVAKGEMAVLRKYESAGTITFTRPNPTAIPHQEGM